MYPNVSQPSSQNVFRKYLTVSAGKCGSLTSKELDRIDLFDGFLGAFLSKCPCPLNYRSTNQIHCCLDKQFYFENTFLQMTKGFCFLKQTRF